MSGAPLRLRPPRVDPPRDPSRLRCSRCPARGRSGRGCGGLLLFFVVTVVLLGLFSNRSALEILDWKPTRSPEVEAENEIDDVEQMLAAQNELRRRLGKPERTLEEIQSEWRGS